MFDSLWWREDADGNPESCSAIECSIFMDGPKRIVAQTELAPGVMLSTVFLGLDHNHSGEGPPILYETMLLNEKGDDGYQERYATRAEAAARHAEMIEEVRIRMGLKLE